MAFQKMATSTITPGGFEVNSCANLNIQRESFEANGFGQWSFGGSLQDGITGTGTQDIPDYIDIRMDATQEMIADGYTFTVRVEMYVENAAITVTPVLYDVTTVGAPAVVTTAGGSASSSTTIVRQSLTFTHTAGTVFYRLRAQKSAATYLAFMQGTLERSVA